MATPEKRSDFHLSNDIIYQLSPEQRHWVYEQEKSRLEKLPTKMSRAAWALLIVYAIGLALMYSQIGRTIFTLIETGKWVFEPEHNLFRDLLEAAILLSMPLLMVGAFAVLLGPPTAIVLSVVMMLGAAAKWLGIRKR